MKIQFKIVAFLLLVGLFFASCTKEEPVVLTPNEEAKEKAVGTWVSVYLEEDGVDITSRGMATFIFREDDTMNTNGNDSGFTFNIDGTYLFENDGKNLSLTYSGSGGLANYDVLELTDDKMRLQIDVFGMTRISDFEKR